MEKDNLDFNQKYCERTKAFALAIINLVRQQKYDSLDKHLLGQLLRSGTSVAANFRAVSHSRSLKERYAKLSIVVEEVDETLFWIEILTESKIITTDAAPIAQEGMELLKVFSSYRKKIKQSLNPNL